ncbi:hydroxyneurosporene-O-methyltransferase [Thecamonas trahens ATCC 50062]|uniref:Hydroxyneurosporene-O-methyltransferase n=1 Tax=Thecamonas trahens ATCC 50062 TaxID=461836 RepID=A0A0L0DRM1_THETB|nr:hydroxyneurosporene-O-methyltransferase [Thecamonas trahens ATCC 50062]KNC54902.1 hydroxyneurosporene-O-methyltransferase [Thecamonas trahens ATCC 50062]|eukprot:XP_013753493.1 hydroxyneurosporene-O-methyltransferase [Thecamonas trahens ATCC 50062]
MGYRTRACIAILAVVGLLAFQHTTVLLEELTTISFLPPWPLFTAATAGLTLTERSFAAVAPPGAQILRLATAYVSSASLTASVQLGVWDALAAALPHPLSSRHLAAAIAVPDHIALAKLMTLLAQHGMVERIPGDGSGEDDAWALNHVSRLLVSSHPSSLAPAVALLGGPEHTAPMHDLAAVMRRGAAPGGFAGSHAGKSLWEYLAERPERERVFDDAMQAIEATEKGAGVILDRGSVIGAVRTEWSTSATLAAYQRAGRVSFELGDVFSEELALGPVAAAAGRAGDRVAVVLKHILHDWNATAAAAIVANVARALPPGGELVLIGRVLEPVGCTACPCWPGPAPH